MLNPSSRIKVKKIVEKMKKKNWSCLHDANVAVGWERSKKYMYFWSPLEKKNGRMQSQHRMADEI